MMVQKIAGIGIYEYREKTVESLNNYSLNHFFGHRPFL